MRYLFVRDPQASGKRAGAPRTAADLALVLLHDMATTRSLALGELRVRQRLEELGLTMADCDTLGGNLAEIAARGPQTPEEREILAFYFALGLRGKIRDASGPRREKVSLLLRETLDFLALVFGPRCLHHLTLLDDVERQMVWDLVGGTVLALGREVPVPGVEPVGALGRWCTLFAAAPRPDRRVVAHALLSQGPSSAARLAVVGVLDPSADGDLVASVAEAGQGRTVEALLAEALEAPLELPERSAPEGPEEEGDVPAGDEAAAAPPAAVDPIAVLSPAAPEAAPVGPEEVTVRGRVVRVRGLGRRILRGLTGWALAERVLRAFGSVFLGLRREGTLRLTRRGLVYDEALWMLGRAVAQRTVAIPLEAVAARLDRRQGVAPLLVGLAAAAAAGFVGVLWMLDGFRTGYRPLLLLAAAVVAGGLIADLLLYRISGRLRGRAHLTLDGGEGARIRLEGIRREEAESLLGALAGPSRFGPRPEEAPSS